MSLSFAVSAFREQSPDILTAAIRRYCSEHGVTADSIDPDPWKTVWEHDVLMFYPKNRWTVIRWPENFNLHDVTVCLALSKGLHSIASTIGITEDDLWRHALIEDGTVVDRFANRPDYCCDSEDKADLLRERYKGNSQLVGRKLGIDPTLISPYFVQLCSESATGKAFPDDEFLLGDTWVIRDFWKRLGITLSKGEGCAVALRLGNDFLTKLPALSGEL